MAESEDEGFEEQRKVMLDPTLPVNLVWDPFRQNQEQGIQETASSTAPILHIPSEAEYRDMLQKDQGF